MFKPKRLISAKVCNNLDNTDKAYKNGVFGSPTFIYQNEVFWGDDRLEDCIKWIRSNEK